MASATTLTKTGVTLTLLDPATGSTRTVTRALGADVPLAGE